MSNRRTPQRTSTSTARARRTARATRGGNRSWIIVITVIVAVGVAGVIALSVSQGSTTSEARTAAPGDLVGKVTGIADDTVNAVGNGKTTGLPTPISGPALTTDGKPGVLYIGAEYCPYCAAQRWAMVNALSRFGTFSNLSVTKSSAVDTPASINTFSFYGSSYASDYVSFQPVETNTNERTGSSYKVLETPNDQQSQIESQFNTKGGGIPFIYYNGQYMSSGATYDANALAGKTWDKIAAALADPPSAISAGAIGSANAMTATICILTDNQPATTCSNPAIQALVTTIRAQPSSSASSQ